MLDQRLCIATNDVLHLVNKQADDNVETCVILQRLVSTRISVLIITRNIQTKAGMPAAWQREQRENFIQKSHVSIEPLMLAILKYIGLAFLFTRT